MVGLIIRESELGTRPNERTNERKGPRAPRIACRSSSRSRNPATAATVAVRVRVRASLLPSFLLYASRARPFTVSRRRSGASSISPPEGQTDRGTARAAGGQFNRLKNRLKNHEFPFR